MTSGTLYTYPDNFRAQKTLIAAKYSGATLTVSEDFVFGETNKSPEFLKKFPLGKVPAFEGSNGVLLTESNAIAYYVANEELRGGSDAASRAQVVQWMSWADNEVLPASCTWVFPTMGIMQFNKSNTERAKEDIKVALKCLNDHLLTKTFLVGERLSLADISVATTMLNLYKHVLDPAFRKPFGNVNRWFTTVVNQPNVKAVIGAVTLAAKMAEFDSKKYAEFSGKGGDKKVEKKKQEKPKQAPKKAEKKEEKEEEAPKMPEKKITITNDKGRLSKEEIERMVNDAEKFKDDDDKQKERISAKNSLESYCFSMKKTLDDEKVKDKISEDDQKAILDKCYETIKWLDANQLAEVEEFNDKKNEVEGICNPIITKMFLLNVRSCYHN